MKFACALLIIILFGGISILYSLDGQGAQTKNEKSKDGIDIHVIVDEVQIDAVVTGMNGKQVADLKAEDFEIYQDGQLQKVSSAIYMSNQSDSRISAFGPRSKTAPRVSAPQLKREDVKRTIAFVVDDAAMSAIAASGDSEAISDSFGMVNRARKTLRYFIEKQMNPGDLVSILPTSSGNASVFMFTPEKEHLLESVEKIRWNPDDVQSTHYLPQYPAVLYAINALRDMPGRKALILISPQTLTPPDLPLKTLDAPINTVNTPAILRAYDALADQALRAGVVIHSLDMRGLLIGDPDRPFQSELPLSKKTGGMFITNSNFFANGIGKEVDEQMKGYYLLSYIPPPDTYTAEGDEKYRRIKIKVKRPGMEINHRDGFFSSTKTKQDLAAKYGDALLKALFSPFQHNDLSIDLSASYKDDPLKGFLVQASLHLDGEQVTILEEKEEASIVLKTSAVTTDVNGIIRDTGRTAYKVKLAKNEIASVRKNGISFSMEIPTKTHGTYYVRVAVQDIGSGKIGSAYQYIKIPDLTDKRLALSSIVMGGEAQGAVPSRILRNYLPGESINYSAVLYNATQIKKKPLELQHYYVLFKDGREVARSAPEQINTDGISDPKRIPINKALSIDAALDPGDYVLQLIVEDKLADKKNRLASQAIDFSVKSKTNISLIGSEHGNIH